MKNDKISKETTENTKSQNFKNKITSKHLTHLDNFIQQCLDKFKFIDPKQEFYDATGDEKDLIISHKSTIPDLVIWNKKFNKNDCFEESNTKKMNPFPRFQFYLRIKSNKPDKDKKKEKKNEKEKNGQNNKAKKEKEKKNKKKQDKKNNNHNVNSNNNNGNNNNSSNNINSLSINNNAVNASENGNSNNNNNMNFNSKSEKKIYDLSELDINKVKEYNPRHKNNLFSSNKEIMNMNDNNKNLKEIGVNADMTSPDKIFLSGFPPKEYFNNSMNNQNKMGGNNFYKNYNEMQGNNDINITINNNNYFQQYQLNNNNINSLININNNNNNDLIFGLKKQYNFNNNNQNDINKEMNNFNYLQNQNNYLDNNSIANEINKNGGWIVMDTNNIILKCLNSFELYIFLSKNSNKKYIIIDKNQKYKFTGDKMLKILSQSFENNINNNQMQFNQLEMMKQQNNLKNMQNMNNKMNINTLYLT